MSDSMLEWMGEVAEMFGFGSSEPEDGGSCEPVRPPEIIAASSAAQTTTGETTEETLSEGGDFVEGCDAGGCCSSFCELDDPQACAGLEPMMCLSYFDPEAVPMGFEQLGICVVPEP